MNKNYNSCNDVETKSNSCQNKDELTLLIRMWVLKWNRVKHLVEQLQSSVKVNFNPTRRLFDGLSWVVWSPAFYKRKSQNAQSPQVIDSNASRTG